MLDASPTTQPIVEAQHLVAPSAEYSNGLDSTCDVTNGDVVASGPLPFDMIPKTKKTVSTTEDKPAGN